MSKMCYINNKFSKIAKRWKLYPRRTINLRFWWPEVAVMTSIQWRHRITTPKTSPNQCHKSFLFWAPPKQNFGYASVF